ncbi:MAG: hypothetical protein HFACDABA_02859 [Anaerolineales bacterium]|nr:hypothetical protein [Anaerolineales bacterium]
MADKALGFVSNIFTKDGKTYVTLVLNYEELRETPLMLGEFVKVKTGAYYKGNDNVYLGMVTASQYRPVTYDKFQEALALGRLNQLPPDENTVKNINFLHYDIVILGSYTSNKGEQYKFYPSTRHVPSLIDVVVSHLEEKEMQALINVSIQTDLSPQEIHLTDLGFLRIGSAVTGEYKNIKKQVDISSFRGKRTANFGKTGFGKSNENKVVLTLLKKTYPKIGMLIFDLNGEYATQKTAKTAMGLIEVFEKLSISQDIVWFTNRQQELESTSPIYTAKPIKINFYSEPGLAIELSYQREVVSGGKPPQYLESARMGLDPESGEWVNIPNKMAYVYGTFLAAGLKVPQMSVTYASKTYSLPRDKQELLEKLNEKAEKGESKEGARELFQYAKRFSFLNDLHTPDKVDEFFSSATESAIAGKTVVVDLPTVRPELVDFISARLANRVFQKALARYSSSESEEKRLTDVLFVIEEAHNLLSNPEGVFYRIAKEGRKYGIGLLYSTQSPKTIPIDILSQTENFLVKHVSSEDDVEQLRKSKVAFGKPISDFILNEPVLGLSYVYMEPYQPFPVPVQVRLLEDVLQGLKK